MWCGNIEEDTTIGITGRVTSRLKNEGKRVRRGGGDILTHPGRRLLLQNQNVPGVQGGRRSKEVGDMADMVGLGQISRNCSILVSAYSDNLPFFLV